VQNRGVTSNPSFHPIHQMQHLISLSLFIIIRTIQLLSLTKLTLIHGSWPVSVEDSSLTKGAGGMQCPVFTMC
jgi:hypothetical protein